MKRNHKIIIGLIAAASISGVAIAQGGRGCDGPGPMGSMSRQVAMKFDPAARAERRLEMLKGQLKLTPQQEPLWQAFAEKAKGEAGKGMKAMRDQAVDEKLTAPERMAKMQTMMKERLAAMDGVNESFNRLYAELTPEQKLVADQHAAQMGKGAMGRMGDRPRSPGRGMPPQS